MLGGSISAGNEIPADVTRHPRRSRRTELPPIAVATSERDRPHRQRERAALPAHRVGLCRADGRRAQDHQRLLVRCRVEGAALQPDRLLRRKWQRTFAPFGNREPRSLIRLFSVRHIAGQPPYRRCREQLLFVRESAQRAMAAFSDP